MKIRIAIVAALLGMLSMGVARAQQGRTVQQPDTLIFTTMDQLEANVKAVAEAVRRNRAAQSNELTAENIKLLKYQMLLNALGMNLGGHEHTASCHKAEQAPKSNGGVEARLDRLEAMISQLLGGRASNQRPHQVVIERAPSEGAADPMSEARLDRLEAMISQLLGGRASDQRPHQVVIERAPSEGAVDSMLDARLDSLGMLLQQLDRELPVLAATDTVTLSTTVSYFKRQVFFPVSKYALTGTARKTLNEVVKIMQEDPEMHLFLTGYASPEGPRDFNLRLSAQRAESVLRYLTEHGISRDRFHVVNGGIDGEDDLRATARRVDLNLRK